MKVSPRRLVSLLYHLVRLVLVFHLSDLLIIPYDNLGLPRAPTIVIEAGSNTFGSLKFKCVKSLFEKMSTEIIYEVKG